MGKTLRRNKLVSKVVASTKRCSACKLDISCKDFSKHRSTPDGLHNQCKACGKKSGMKHRNTEHGFMYNMWKTAKSSNKERNEKGRRHEFTLTVDQMKAKWIQQKGLCAITGVRMVLKPHSHWKCSIERIQNAMGYTDGNTILICMELNTPSQWTNAKAAYLFAHTVHNPVDLRDDLQPPRRPNKGTITLKKWPILENNTVLCHFCDETKDLEQFYKSCLHRGCKDCSKIKTAARINSWWGALYNLHGHAIQNSKQRGMECPLKLEELKQILLDQKGLCYYSGVPMSPMLGDYRMSLERVNVLDTYTCTNSVLCVKEFNSMDNTRIKTEFSNDGNSGWSNSKYLHAQRTFNNK